MAHIHSGHDHGHAGHGHGRAPGGHVHVPAGFGMAFAGGVVLDVGFVAVEAVRGVLANSMALLADAGHNLSDALGLPARPAMVKPQSIVPRARPARPAGR